jgi:hypothetical protein
MKTPLVLKRRSAMIEALKKSLAGRSRNCLTYMDWETGENHTETLQLPTHEEALMCGCSPRWALRQVCI